MRRWRPERLRNTSKLRRQALEETTQAIDKAIEKEKELVQVQAQAGGVNYGNSAQPDGSRPAAAQVAQAGGRHALNSGPRGMSRGPAVLRPACRPDAYRIANLVLAELRDGQSAAGR